MMGVPRRPPNRVNEITRPSTAKPLFYKAFTSLLASPQNPISPLRSRCSLPFPSPTHRNPTGSRCNLVGETMELPVAAAAAASFPVVFFDGDREVEIGTVAVHPVLDFKKFQAVISQKIGIASHQISTFLVRRKKGRASPEVRRKVPIDESSDFAAIARERDCFVLAVLRRSRKERRGRSRRGHRHDAAAGGDGEADAGQKKAVSVAASTVPEKTILRRNPAGSRFVDPALAALMPDAIGLGPYDWDYERQLRDLQRQREKYLLSTAAYYPYAVAESRYAWDAAKMSATTEGSALARPAVCEECEGAKGEGRPPGFHWCVYDAVTVGFRSPVGPIQRPSKKHSPA